MSFIHSIIYIIGTYIPGGISSSLCWRYEWFFSANLFASLLSILSGKIVMSIFYPNDKLTRIDIYSNKGQEIINIFTQRNYHHTFITIDGIVGNNKKLTSMLLTVCLHSELSNVIRLIRLVDPECPIFAYMIKEINAKIRVPEKK